MKMMFNEEQSENIFYIYNLIFYKFNTLTILIILINKNDH